MPPRHKKVTKLSSIFGLFVLRLDIVRLIPSSIIFGFSADQSQIVRLNKRTFSCQKIVKCRYFFHTSVYNFLIDDHIVKVAFVDVLIKTILCIPKGNK